MMPELETARDVGVLGALGGLMTFFFAQTWKVIQQNRNGSGRNGPTAGWQASVSAELKHLTDELRTGVAQLTRMAEAQAEELREVKRLGDKQCVVLTTLEKTLDRWLSQQQR